MLLNTGHLFSVLFFMTCTILFFACQDEKEDPLVIEVKWTGQVKDGYQDIPLANQEVLLVSFHWWNFPPVVVYDDTLQVTTTDENGFFSFDYTDPNEKGHWYSVHTSHPDYLDKIAEKRHDPVLEEYESEIRMKPKAWLRIRVLDVPEYNVLDSCIGFYNLNDEADYYWLNSGNFIYLCPSTGDSTFLAFKPGGETTAFAYYNSDSMKYSPYQDVFPPFDTTELEFLY